MNVGVNCYILRKAADDIRAVAYWSVCCCVVIIVVVHLVSVVDYVDYSTAADAASSYLSVVTCCYLHRRAEAK